MAIVSDTSRGLRSEINVTPLVDVVLVLLIIFMVVTPVLQRGKEVDLPAAQGDDAAERQQDVLVISMTRDRHVWIDNDEYALEGLSGAVSRELRSSGHRRVLLKGDRSLKVGDVRAVMRAIRSGGAQDLVLAVKEQPAAR